MAQILICGLAVVDFVFSVDDMPRTAEKYRATGLEIVGGGGGANAAVAITRLGGRAKLIARVADDDIGTLIRRDLVSAGVDTEMMIEGRGGRSAMSSVFVDQAGERQIVNFRGEGLPDAAEIISKTDAPADAVMVDTRWIEGAVALLNLARARGIPGVVDAEAPVDDRIVHAASHVAFSEQGLRDYAGADLERGIGDVSGAHPGWFAVTLGGDGVLYGRGGEIVHHPAKPVTAVDTLGAGDVWHGAFTLALAEGLDEAAAVAFASDAAALKCTRKGGRTTWPTRAELAAFRNA